MKAHHSVLIKSLLGMLALGESALIVAPSGQAPVAITDGEERLVAGYPPLFARGRGHQGPDHQGLHAHSDKVTEIIYNRYHKLNQQIHPINHLINII
jgi:hypothetical protein